MPTPASQNADDDRIIVYQGLAYRRLDDGVLAAPAPTGSFHTVPKASLPLPVARALGLRAPRHTWFPTA